MSRRKGRRSHTPLTPAPPESEAARVAELVYHMRYALRVIADKVGATYAADTIKQRDEILRRVSADPLLQENLQWREFAWLSCPHDIMGKYGDDGEMQCRGADFRRDKIEELSEHLRRARGFEGPDRALDRMAEMVAEAESFVAGLGRS